MFWYREETANPLHIDLKSAPDRHAAWRRRSPPREVHTIAALEASWGTRSRQLRYTPTAGWRCFTDTAFDLAVSSAIHFFRNIAGGRRSHDGSEAHGTAHLYAVRARAWTFRQRRTRFEADQNDGWIGRINGSARLMYHERLQGHHLTRRYRRPGHSPESLGRSVIIGVKNHIDINRTSSRNPQGVSVSTEIDPIWTHQWHRRSFYDGLVVGEVYAPVARDLDGRLDAGADCVDRDLFTGLRGPAAYSRGLVDPAPGAAAGSDPLNVGGVDIRHIQPDPPHAQRPACS